MKGSEFIRRLRKVARLQGIEIRLDERRGKGSHSTLYFGSARTVIKDLNQELPRGTLRAMLKQLGLTEKDLHGE